MSNENVAQFTRKDDQVEPDPFEQAEQTEELENANQKEEMEHEVPDDLGAAIDKPEPVEKPKPLKKPAKAKTGRGLAVTAIAMSAIAIGVSGYSTYSQNAINAALTEELTQLDGYAINTRMTQDTIVKQLEANTQAIKANTESVAGFNDLRGEMLIYTSALEQMQGDITSMNGAVTEGQKFIGEQRTAITNLIGRVEKLEDQPVKTVTRVVRRAPAKPAPKAADPTKIEGASLASIDAWGAQTNVMLRDDSGTWIPLSQGDYYKGWQFVSVNGNSATFKDGRKTKTVQVEG